MRRSRPRVLFRVAAGPRIGFGHLMRCRALARSLGVRPHVSIRGSAATRRTAASLGCRVATGSPIDSLATVDVLVVDDPSPMWAEAWLARATAEGVSTATIHDLGRGSHAADLVVDGSITARPSHRSNSRLGGTSFTILDPQVLQVRTARRAPRRGSRPRVLIALGGGSHVLGVVRALVGEIARRCPYAAIVVAAGFCSSGRRPALQHGRWIERRQGLAREIAASDVAVVAGGVTLYEACAIGIPVVGLAVVPPQHEAIKAFASRGAVVDAGCVSDRSAAMKRAAERVARLLTQGDGGCGVTARRLVDGKGSHRVAARLRALAVRSHRKANHG